MAVLDCARDAGGTVVTSDARVALLLSQGQLEHCFCSTTYGSQWQHDCYWHSLLVRKLSRWVIERWCQWHHSIKLE